MLSIKIGIFLPSKSYLKAEFIQSIKGNFSLGAL